MFKKLTAPTLKELFVQELEALILSGELAIGQKLPSERTVSSTGSDTPSLSTQTRWLMR